MTAIARVHNPFVRTEYQILVDAMTSTLIDVFPPNAVWRDNNAALALMRCGFARSEILEALPDVRRAYEGPRGVAGLITEG